MCLLKLIAATSKNGFTFNIDKLKAPYQPRQRLKKQGLEYCNYKSHTKKYDTLKIMYKNKGLLHLLSIGNTEVVTQLLRS